MRWTPVIAFLLLALVTPARALADGGPAQPVQGGSGIAAPGSPYRYAALAGGHGGTVVKRSGTGLGTGGTGSASSIRLAGAYGIPGVGVDGQTTGLSADGRTLVLAEILGYMPPRTTRLIVLDAPRLAVRARISLPGWSVVDAISPDGRRLYLIHYPSADINRYEVLAYDLVTRHILAKPIVDPHDGDEPMTGFPITRVMSPGDRWAYTLYARPSGAPFIHALDTVGARAVCVDLPSPLASIDIGNAQLALGAGGSTIGVVADGMTQAVVDTRTFAVTPVAVTPASSVAFSPGPVAPVSIHPVAHKTQAHGGAGSVSWVLLVAAVAVAAIGGVHAVACRPAPPI